MLEMSTRNLRFLARMGARGCLGQAVFDYMNDGNDAFVVSADLVYASGFDRVKKSYGDRLINVGIAEQNLIGIAAGLSSKNTPVVATTWAMFASSRVADQVRNYMGFMQSNVKLIGMDSGFVQSRFSYSHTNPPDIAIMRTIPGIMILSPCDGIEIYKAIYQALEYDGPVYIRLTGTDLQPMIHKTTEVSFQIGKSIILKQGTDVAIIATGNIVEEALKASAILEKRGISTKVVDMHTIVPLDENMLTSLIQYKMVITLEEHLKAGGMGSAVAEYYSSYQYHPKHIIMGVDNFFPKCGGMDYIREKTGLSARHIADRIIFELEPIKMGENKNAK